jgi:2-oxoglutarate ferredoxin oxidoreductase subunit delta
MPVKEIFNVSGKHLGYFEAWCKACGICIALCPKKVFDTGTDGKPIVARPQDCINCGMCEIMCPDFAIGWYMDPLHDEELKEAHKRSIEDEWAKNK